MRQFVSFSPFTGNRVELSKVENQDDIPKRIAEMPFSSTFQRGVVILGVVPLVGEGNLRPAINTNRARLDAMISDMEKVFLSPKDESVPFPVFSNKQSPRSNHSSGSSPACCRRNFSTSPRVDPGISTGFYHDTPLHFPPPHRFQP